MNPVTLKVSTNSIYSHSISKVEASAPSPFSIKLSTGVILSLARGRQEKGVISATSDGDIFVIRFEVLDWIVERPISTRESSDKNMPGYRYGMRYYPFISSYIQFDLNVNNGSLHCLILEIPDEFRVIWYAASVRDPDGEPFGIDHSYSRDISTYIFTKDEMGPEGEYKIFIPVRTGATEILKIVSFSMFYYFLALIGVALASFSAKSSILIASIATAWVFMLRRWGNSNLPQRNTILTHIYIGAGGFLLFWGAMWEILSLTALAFAIPILILYLLAGKALRLFNLEGYLPAYIVRYWSRQIVKADTQQRQISGRERF